MTTFIWSVNSDEGVRIYWSLWHFSMVSDNDSEFTDLKAEFTDSKASLNQFDSGSRISSQNFLISFQNFNFLTYLSL